MDALDPRHGTNAGYYAHSRDSEKPCRPCADAASAARLDRKRRQAAKAAEELGYDGGWVRNGLTLSPSIVDRRDECAERIDALLTVRDRIDAEMKVLLAEIDNRPTTGRRSRLVKPPCGTESAYQRHQHSRDTATDKRIVTCQPCLEAHREHERIRAARAKLRRAS